MLLHGFLTVSIVTTKRSEVSLVFFLPSIICFPEGVISYLDTCSTFFFLSLEFKNVLSMCLDVGLLKLIYLKYVSPFNLYILWSLSSLETFSSRKDFITSFSTVLGFSLIVL